MGRPCAAAGLICSKHVQIGRPTQTIKVEWRFCSTRHFCLTRSTRMPSKEQTDHKRKEEKKKHTQAHSHNRLGYCIITQRRTDCHSLTLGYSTSKHCFTYQLWWNQVLRISICFPDHSFTFSSFDSKRLFFRNIQSNTNTPFFLPKWPQMSMKREGRTLKKRWGLERTLRKYIHKHRVFAFKRYI